MDPKERAERMDGAGEHDFDDLSEGNEVVCSRASLQEKY
jgi:hypothetical protein